MKVGIRVRAGVRVGVRVGVGVRVVAKHDNTCPPLFRAGGSLQHRSAMFIATHRIAPFGVGCLGVRVPVAYLSWSLDDDGPRAVVSCTTSFLPSFLISFLPSLANFLPSLAHFLASFLYCSVVGCSLP